MGIKIIKKDISWLTDKVKDFDIFLESQSYYFNNNGYLAGGFLKRAINRGSVVGLLEEPESDIDFFFYNQKSCEDAYLYFYSLKGSFTNGPYNNKQALKPNSISGFAFEGNGVVKISAGKLPPQKFQFIYKNVGTPEEVLNRFDMANSKIATDGKSVWMVEDWEELENNKIVRVDNLAGKYLASRLKKYIGKDYSLHPTNYQEVIIKLLELLTDNENKPISAVQSLVGNKNVISNPSDVLLFHELLGETWQNTTPEDYEKGTLGQKEDFAAHVYIERMKENNVRA